MSQAIPDAATRDLANTTSKRRYSLVFVAGGLAFAACWWLGLSGMISTFVCILTGAAARFLPWIATAPVERAVKTSINQSVAAELGLAYREHNAPPAAYTQAQFKIVGIPVKLPDQMKAQVDDILGGAAGDRTLEGISATAFDIASKAGLLPSHTDRMARDYWSGTISGQPFDLFQLELLRKHNRRSLSDDPTNDYDTTDTEFHGVVMTLGIPDPAAHWAQSQQEWQGKTVYILSHANQRIAVIETGTLFASGSLYAEDDAPERAALAQMVNLLALAKNLQGD